MSDAPGSSPCSWPNVHVCPVAGSTTAGGCQVGYRRPSGPTTEKRSWSAAGQVSAAEGVHARVEDANDARTGGSGAGSPSDGTATGDGSGTGGDEATGIAGLGAGRT